MMINFFLALSMTAGPFQGDNRDHTLEIVEVEGRHMALSLGGLGTYEAAWTSCALDAPENELHRIPFRFPLVEVPGGSRVSLLRLPDNRWLAAMDACSGSCWTYFLQGEARSGEIIDFKESPRQLVLTAWRDGDSWVHRDALVRPTLLMDGSDPRLIGSHCWGDTVFLTDPGALAAFLELGLTSQEAEVRREARGHHSQEDVEIGGDDGCLGARVILKGSNPRVCRVGERTFIGVEEPAKRGKPVTVHLYSSEDLLVWSPVAMPAPMRRPLAQWNLAVSNARVYFLGAIQEGAEQACELWELSQQGTDWTRFAACRLPGNVARVAHSTRSGGPVIVAHDEDGKLEIH